MLRSTLQKEIDFSIQYKNQFFYFNRFFEQVYSAIMAVRNICSAWKSVDIMATAYSIGSGNTRSMRKSFSWILRNIPISENMCLLVLSFWHKSHGYHLPPLIRWNQLKISILLCCLFTKLARGNSSRRDNALTSTLSFPDIRPMTVVNWLMISSCLIVDRMELSWFFGWKRK